MLKHHNISEFKTIVYCWAPSHVGIYDNEQVDKKAKESLRLEQTDFKIPFVNFKPFINEYVFNEWQSIWSRADDNKLKEIEPHVKRPRSETGRDCSFSSSNWSYTIDTFIFTLTRR